MVIKIKPDIGWNKLNPFEILGVHFATDNISDYNKTDIDYYIWITIINIDIGFVLLYRKEKPKKVKFKLKNGETITLTSRR